MVNAAKISGASAFLRQMFLIYVDIDSIKTATAAYYLILQTISNLKREKATS